MGFKVPVDEHQPLHHQQHAADGPHIGADRVTDMGPVVDKKLDAKEGRHIDQRRHRRE